MDAPSIAQLRELVAHAWFTIGYPPVDSLVLVEVRASGAPGVTARIDQPPPSPPARPDDPPAPAPAGARRVVAQTLAGFSRRAGVRAAVLLVVGSGARAAPPPFGRPEAALVRSVRQGLRAAGVRVAGIALVGVDGRAGAGWIRLLDCTDPSCCPPGGVPLGDLHATRTAALMVLDGRVLAAGEADLVADVQPSPWPGSVLLAEPPAAPPVSGLTRWRALHAARTATSGSARDPSPAEVAWLVPGLRDARLRDAVLVSLLPAPPGSGFRRNGDDPAADLAAGRAEAMPDLREFTDRPPDRRAFESARVLLAAVARGAPEGERAEALAVLAWMAWWQGSGARGRLLVGLALADRPGHRLAAIVDRLLAYGVPPSWVDGQRLDLRTARPRGG
jgi:Domain of unknown function (DUF4192)